MNILITGGRGQLGLSLEKVAQECIIHDFIFTDMPEADITNGELMSSLVAVKHIDVIVNCAAYTAVDKAEGEFDLAEKINSVGPRILAQIAKKAEIPLIHISTDYVFDGMASSPYKETASTNPIGVYGRTKLAGEHNILDVGINAIILRTSWLYSEFGANFVKTMMRLVETRNEINVVNDQIGTPTYATDLAMAIITLINREIIGTEIYHYSNEGKVSWYDFAVEIFRQFGNNIKVNPISTAQYPTLAVRPAYSVLDKTKIKMIGIEVPFWKDSLEACINTFDKYDNSKII